MQPIAAHATQHSKSPCESSIGEVKAPSLWSRRKLFASQFLEIYGNLVSQSGESVSLSYWLSIGSWLGAERYRATEPPPSCSSCFEDSDHDSELHASRGSHCPKQFCVSLMWYVWFLMILRRIRREINAGVSLCGLLGWDSALTHDDPDILAKSAEICRKHWISNFVRTVRAGVSYCVRTCPTL